MTSSRPNIVMICVDQWRGDCLELDGHPVVKTPYLNQIALGGTRFSSAFSTCPSCVASRASLLTGCAPPTTGRVGYLDGIPWNYSHTLPSILAQNGYHCQSIGKMHVFPERNKVGFHDVILHDGYLHHARRRHAPDLEAVDDYIAYLRKETGRADADYFEHGVGCNSFIARPWDKPEYLHPTNFVTARSVEYLHKRRNDPRPFFLFCSYHRPHPPYDPPQWAFDHYMQNEMPPVPVGEWSEFLSQYASGRPDSPVAMLSAQDLQRTRAGYYGHMTHIDHQLDRILEALGEAGARDDTLLVFVSDHGEMMGDHHLFAKSLPYEGSARVPLLISGVGLPSGAVCNSVVALEDLAPTLLDLVGLPSAPGMDGVSFAPSLRNGANPAARSLLHGEHPYQGEHSVQFIIDATWKYVWWSGDGREQLFKRTDDPQELRDVSRDHPEQLQRLRQVLAKNLGGRPEGYSDGTRLIAGRPPMAVLPWAETGRTPPKDHPEI